MTVCQRKALDVAKMVCRRGLLFALLVSVLPCVFPAPSPRNNGTLTELIGRYSKLLQELENTSNADRGTTAAELEGILKQIGQAEDRQSILFLARELPRLTSTNPDLGAECAALLLHSGQPTAISIVLARFGLSPTVVQERILATLATLDVDPRPHAAAIIEAALYVQDEGVQKALLPFLTRIGTPQAFEAMIARIERWNASMVHGSTSTYESQVWTALSDARQSVIRGWLAGPAFHLFEAQPIQLRLLAALAGRSGNLGAIDSLLHLLTHVDLTVRALALESVLLLGADETRVLRAWAPDHARFEESFVLAAARDVVRGSPCTEPTGAMELTQAVDPAIRLLSFLRLSTCDGDLQFETLVGGLTDSEAAVRSACFAALLRKREPRTVDRLLKILEAGRNSRASVATARVLTELTGQSLGHDAAAWRSWWDGAREEFRFSEGRSRTFVPPEWMLEDPKAPASVEFFDEWYEAEAVIYCVDRSFTMWREGWLRTAQQAIARSIQGLASDALFAVVVFDAGVLRYPASGLPAEATPENKHSAIQWVSSVRVGSGSAFFSGMTEALRFTHHCTRERIAVLYLGDGAGTDPKQLRALAIQNVKNARIHTIGVGRMSPGNRRFCESLTRMNQGTHRHIKP